MNLALILSALLMGLAGSVHCVAMCGAPSAALVQRCGTGRSGPRWAGFHLGRALGYGAAGAAVASSVSALAWLGQWSPALRPLWTLAHLAALGLGLYLLLKGRQPVWLDALGREGQRASSLADGQGWQRMHGPVRAAAVGSLWFAWPCGLLQSALMVAALANGPAGGAVVMLAFACSSALALGLAPALWARAGGRHQARLTVLIVRLSGLALALASIWALGHDLLVRFAAWCMS